MMKLPLKLFWTLVKSKNRIMASENMRLGRIALLHMLDENSKKDYFESQSSIVGKVTLSDERDEEGIQKLKNMM